MAVVPGEGLRFCRTAGSLACILPAKVCDIRCGCGFLAGHPARDTDTRSRAALEFLPPAALCAKADGSSSRVPDGAHSAVKGPCRQCPGPPRFPPERGDDSSAVPGLTWGVCRRQNESAGGFVITIRDAAGPAVPAAFEDVELTAADDTTVLHRSAGHQAALSGILQQVQDPGLEVAEVHRTQRTPT